MRAASKRLASFLIAALLWLPAPASLARGDASAAVPLRADTISAPKPGAVDLDVAQARTSAWAHVREQGPATAHPAIASAPPLSVATERGRRLTRAADRRPASPAILPHANRGPPAVLFL